MLGSSSDIPLPEISQVGPLFRLPTELRTKILKVLLCQHGSICYSGEQDEVDPEPFHFKWIFGCPELAIMSTCRQLYHEGAHIFFTGNTFSTDIVVHDGLCGYDEDLETFDFVGFKTVEKAFEQCPNFRRIARLEVTISAVFLDTTCETLQQRSREDRHILISVPRFLQSNLGRMEKITFDFCGYRIDQDLSGSSADLLMREFKHLRANKVNFHRYSTSAAEKLRAVMEGP